MDLSKLPKLSDSSQSAPPQSSPSHSPPPSAPAPEAQPAPVRYASPTTPSAGVSADIWFNVVVAIILMFLGRAFLFWALATLTHQPYHTNVNWMEGPKAGEEVSYF